MVSNLFWMGKRSIIFIFFSLHFFYLSAQDTLPRFSVIDKGNNRIQIKWINPFSTCNQILIQRSFDSSKNFKTIFSVPSPKQPINGYVDNAAPINNMYYRIFYVLDGGNYFFTEAKRSQDPNVYLKKDSTPSVEYIDKRTIVVKKEDSILYTFDVGRFEQFKDSILHTTRDTLFSKTFDTVLLKSFIPKEVFIPSIYIFTEKEGHVKIALPDVPQKHYRVHFFEMDDTPLFEMKNIKEPFLIVDKTNFIHAGWFKFELYEDQNLKEKNKIYIPKDF